MIEYRKARLEDVKGIIQVCSDGYRNTYPELIQMDHIENIIMEYYNENRIKNELSNISQEWNGWFVAVENGQVIGAGGGGFVAPEIAELYVIYLNPNRKREGIGSNLLAIITEDQIKRGAKQQYVSVIKGNLIGTPFYEKVGFIYDSEHPAHGLPEEEGYKSLRYKRNLTSS
ncbi:GNAT family N-acetyltransferase [Bacillus solimangrovi]|uniref:GNAT family N-acetyltransferase n=1 Tax=Bacillus solimangrovi TaxID=1305675 RepID=A0A1E5LHJ4_9BACI|nr:GNAT family N-acetyltransferase [Bacillus solimangrovi]OEH93562.1 GNAT family N-acetyltransferase [Bacillus solimangrovi]